MRRKLLISLLIIMLVVLMVAGCSTEAVTVPTTVIVASVTPAPLATKTSPPLNPQELLQRAIEHFISVSSFQMSTHEVVSYRAIVADGTVRSIYGEYKTVYDILRSPEFKVRVRSQFRYSPDAEFIDEEYCLFEQDGMAFILTFDGEGAPVAEETGSPSVDILMGDVYQAIVQYGTEALFTSQDAAEIVYTLDHPGWYTLQGAIGFADLGLLSSQPNGAELVKDYVEQIYPNVQTVRFVIHVSKADKVITKVELDNRAFMQSFWEEYDCALMDQGADPDQLTRYEIQPEHGNEVLFSHYNQVSDFNIPNY